MNQRGWLAVGLLGLATIIVAMVGMDAGVLRVVLATVGALAVLVGKAGTFGFTPGAFATCWRQSWMFRVTTAILAPVLILTVMAAASKSDPKSLSDVILPALVVSVILMADLRQQRSGDDVSTRGSRLDSGVRNPVG